MNKSNIVLIGMPAAGKSTIGVLLAKAMKMPFIDTDLLVQQRENLLLQEIINHFGIEKFLLAEESVILNIAVENHVIATGGSVVYSTASIRHLKEKGVLVYLCLGYQEIEQRLNNITTRGIAISGNQSLSDLYNERAPLYEENADIIIDCSGKHIESIVSEIKGKVQKIF